jgi:hypothetical protein
MGNRPSLLSSRVALAIAGAVIVGGISAAAVVKPMLSHGTALAVTSQSQTNLSPTRSPTPETTPTVVPTPTATAQPRPTPAPTRTPVPTLQGIVGTVGSSSFALQAGGVSRTVNVNAGTVFRYQGAPSSLSALQPGWHAVARGAYQMGGTFLASWVESCSTLCDN